VDPDIHDRLVFQFKYLALLPKVLNGESDIHCSPHIDPMSVYPHLEDEIASL